MTGRFSRTEAVAIFGVLFFCCLAFFLLGVVAGRTFFVPTVPDPVASLDQAQQAAPQDLDFYSGLVDRGQQDSQAGQSTDGADAAEAGASGADASGEAAGTAGNTSDGRAATVPASEAPQPTVESSPYWTVQVGALDTTDEARQVILRLEAKGYSARLVDPSEGGDRFFRVWVGEFRDEAAARRFEERLKADGFHTYAKKIEAPGRPR